MTSLLPPLLLAGAALLGNLVGVDLVLDTEYLFGSIFTLLLIHRHGAAWGIPAALVASIPTIFRWHHPYGMVIFCAEALVVSFLHRRKGFDLLLADLSFWLLPGIALTALSFGWARHLEYSVTLLLMAKYAINGTCNALFARTLSLFLNRPVTADGSVQQHSMSLRDLFFVLLAAFVFLPALLSIALISQHEQERTRDSVISSLTNVASQTQQLLTPWMNRRMSQISSLAQFAKNASPRELNEHLLLDQQEDFDFFRIGVYDRLGTIVAYSLEQDEEGSPFVGRHLGTTPFVNELRQRRTILVSEIITARMGTPTPVVLIGAPVIREGLFSGHVVGLVSLNSLRQLLTGIARNWGMEATIIDSRDRVIASTRADLTAMASLPRPVGETIQEVSKGVFHRLPTSAAQPARLARLHNADYFTIRPVADNVPWRLLVEAPVAPHQQGLSLHFAHILLILLAIMTVTVLLAALVSRQLVESLNRLGTITAGFVGRRSLPMGIEWPRSRLIETASLVDSCRSMAATIAEKFADLERANEELERRVMERTIQLSRSNSELVTEINERKVVEDCLNASLAEKEVLLKEIHHRVKNNLQIISSLISLQAKGLSDERLLGALDDTRNRVRSIALIHEKLYQSPDLSSINFRDYLQGLVHHLVQAHGVDAGRIQVQLDVAEIFLDVSSAIPCGLIATELLVNAFKYAFPDKRSGTIIIRFIPRQRQWLLSISDDGIGLPQAMEPATATSLGLKLVHILAGQLNGTVQVESGRGTTFAVAFPANHEAVGAEDHLHHA